MKTMELGPATESPLYDARRVANAEAQEQERAERYRQAEESFERCDTDGFVSQFVSQLGGRKAGIQAEIERNGGLAQFPALFTLEGIRCRAKLIKGKYGTCWAFCDDRNQFTGEFVSAFPARESTMRKKGYIEGKEWARAKADYIGSGRGLSGLSTCRAVAVRLDDGYPADAS